MSSIDNSITDPIRTIVADALHVSPGSIEIVAVSGGYSRNRRSLVGSDNTWVFVKEVDAELLPDDGEEELWWLKKDYLCTQSLRSVVPELVPEWSRLEADGRALIMTSYRPSDGWLWSPPEDSTLRHLYIQAVVDATRKLEVVEFDEVTIERLKLQPYFRDELVLDEGLALIINNEAIRQQLKDKFSAFAAKPGLLQRQHTEMVALLQDEDALQSLARRASQLMDQPNDCFGHCDVRSDNLTFHPETGEVRFVDWNWASIATRGFGATEFLIDIARRGFDVMPWISDMNIEMLAATVGFYARRCLKEPFAPGSTLRDMQAESAAVALDLYNLSSSLEQRR